MTVVGKAIAAGVLALVGADALLPCGCVTTAFVNSRSRRISPPFPCSCRSTRRVHMSWEDLAAEWTARNRDDSFSRASEGARLPVMHSTVATNDPSVTQVGVAQQSPTATRMAKGHVDNMYHSGLTEVATVIENADNLWSEVDLELLQIQREASEALVDLEKMHEDLDELTDELRAKDERYELQIRELETHGSQIESTLQEKLASMSNDFEAYRASSEQQREAFVREADSKQVELRRQIDELHNQLQEQIRQLHLERIQSTELRNDKAQLGHELQRQRQETAASLKEWQGRVREEQQARERESLDLESKMQRIQEEAAQRTEEQIQRAQAEKEQITLDYSSRLEKLSNDLKVASANVQNAQHIIDEKQSYIQSLEPAVVNLAEWTRESWAQLNLIQDAVGLPVTPPEENGEVPGVEVLEVEAQNLIEHLRSRERYFEDAIFDIQSEMQEKESQMRSRLTKTEKEYDQYRREMSSSLDASRKDASSIEKAMQAQLDALGADLENQRSILAQESQRAKNLMETRMAVEKELAELKREASYVIDELETQLEMEQMTRQKESEKARKALDEVEQLSLRRKKEAAVKEKKQRETEQELSTRVVESEKELEASKLTSGLLLSVAVGSLALTGILIQGFQPDSISNQKSGDTRFEKVSSNRLSDQSKPLREQDEKDFSETKNERATPTAKTNAKKESITWARRSKDKPSAAQSKGDVTPYVPPPKDSFYAIKEEAAELQSGKGGDKASPSVNGQDTASTPSSRSDSKAMTESTSSAKKESSADVAKETTKITEGSSSATFSDRKDDASLPTTEPEEVVEKGSSLPTRKPTPVQKTRARRSTAGADQEELIDWDVLTMKWLDEVKQIQDARARERGDPTKPIDMKNSFKRGTDPLNDPLLNQALAPRPPKQDPFADGNSKK